MILPQLMAKNGTDNLMVERCYNYNYIFKRRQREGETERNRKREKQNKRYYIHHCLREIH